MFALLGCSEPGLGPVSAGAQAGSLPTLLDHCIEEQSEAHGGTPPASQLRMFRSFCEARLGRLANEPFVPPPPPEEPARLRPVPEAWIDTLCGLQRTDGEAELVAGLGAPDLRIQLAGGGRLLQWDHDGGSGVTAEFDEQGLEKAVAFQSNRGLPRATRTANLDAWRVGETTLSEAEARLGRAVVIAVEWQRGLAVSLAEGRRRGLPESMMRAGCSVRVRWPELDLGPFDQLRFRDGVLQGPF